MEKNVAEIMAGIEEMISRHYFACARNMPADQAFWKKIAAEETDHARWIRDLYYKAGEGLVAFNEKRFNKDSLLEFAGKLACMLEQFQEQSKTFKDALADSLQIENMLLEKSFFEIFQSDSPGLKEVLSNLSTSTKEHRIRIELRLKELG